MDKSTSTARELVPFALVAYGIPFLMGIPLAIAQRAGYPTDLFANAQMYYPAAGAIAALLLTRQADAMPRRFFVFHLLTLDRVFLCCLGTVLLPGGGWLVACNLIVILGSLAGWGILLAQKKELRQAAGLGWQKGKLLCGCVVLYILLRTAVVFASAAIAGQLGGLSALLVHALPLYGPLVPAPQLLPQLHALLGGGVRLAVFPPAPAPEPVRDAGRRPGTGSAVGAVASAPELLFPRPKHSLAERGWPADYLRDPGDIFRLGLSQDREHLGSGTAPLLQQQPVGGLHRRRRNQQPDRRLDEYTGVSGTDGVAFLPFLASPVFGKRQN